MVEHLSNDIHWHAIHAWWRKTYILDIAPKRPDTMIDMVITKFVQNRHLNALFPFLVLFGAHILSFYEWKIVQQLLGDNSDVTCVYWQINMQHLREKTGFRCLQFHKVV